MLDNEGEPWGELHDTKEAVVEYVRVTEGYYSERKYGPFSILQVAPVAEVRREAIAEVQRIIERKMAFYGEGNILGPVPKDAIAIVLAELHEELTWDNEDKAKLGE